MGSRLRSCRSCGRYSLAAACPACDAATVSPHPARYSPEDRYASYRRRLKRLVEKEAAAAGGKA